MKTTYQVKGMTCGHCEQSVQEEIGEIDGVTDVHADHTTGKVRVESATPLPEADVRKAVETAGYTLEAEVNASPATGADASN